jgi:hypothetical protein
MADQQPDGTPAPIVNATPATQPPATPPAPPVVTPAAALAPTPSTPPAPAAPAAKTYTQQEWDAEQGRLAAKWEGEKLAPIKAQLEDANKRLTQVATLTSDNERLAALAVPEKLRPLFAKIPASERAAAIEEAHRSGLFAAEPPAPPKPAGSGAASSPPVNNAPAPTLAPVLTSAPGIYDARKVVDHATKKA